MESEPRHDVWMDKTDEFQWLIIGWIRITVDNDIKSFTFRKQPQLELATFILSDYDPVTS